MVNGLKVAKKTVLDEATFVNGADLDLNPKLKHKQLYRSGHSNDNILGFMVYLEV